ncbi:mitochondrial Complex V (CV) ATP synthase F1 complex assembly factor 1 (ATPAF1/Atp11) [Andalucia godoyi]|uniref:Mitochondrial Complex V (CV) ATP synthase F1 complex assembly factor 1 (ATPAF1/Atp11) n=1 Tax=Andalucia godoyi TaxID=505711 RepID=A0A8K0F413_ANDGO|nr:mitochondrial Complex V (CV) ATP synthase F1 complex assembly factor 1 (ATPAF1/Atp11) [Andalucia godoyi]|eukprot:ANDGO_01778.mRNA.1 mitochondrial Complex V (CV) ATP synthase F1 complex assembly factor 1 (ATPAF1/Atp11)
MLQTALRRGVYRPTAVPAFSRAMSFSYPGPRKLGDLVKLPLLERESPEKIRHIWREYHNDEERRTDGKRPSFAEVLESSQYSQLRLRSKQSPMFVFPVLKPKGYINLVTQFQDTFCLATSLEEYQKRRSFSFPHVTITFFEELMKEKNIVLMRADMFSPDLTRDEGQQMFQSLLRFYLSDREYTRFVETFNSRPREFNFQDLLKEIQVTQLNGK